jgi:hypothetical protein
VCNEVLVAQEEVPATGHAHQSAVTAPTCTEQGYTTYTCACGDTYIADKTAPVGHSYGEWVITQPATEKEDGMQKRVCSACGDEQTEVIPARKEQSTEQQTKPPVTEQETDKQETEPSVPEQETNKQETAQGTEPETEGKESGGCGGVVSAGLLVWMLILSAAALIGKKKQRD